MNLTKLITSLQTSANGSSSAIDLMLLSKAIQELDVGTISYVANSSRLGDNTTTARSSPVTVIGGITTWNYLSAGYKHSLAINTTIL